LYDNNALVDYLSRLILKHKNVDLNRVSERVSLVLLDSASGTDLSGCNCPPRCTNFLHRATMSSSRLSDMMMNYYLRQENNNSEIGRRYVNAMETRNRVASSLLQDVIGNLEKLLTTYQRLKAVLAVDLIEQTTSVPGQIHASISMIVQKTQDSLMEFGSQVVDKFTDHYEQNVDFPVTQILRSAKSILSQHFYFANINMSDIDNFNISHVEKIFDYKDAFCKDADTIWESVYDAERKANFSAKLVVDRTCEISDIYGGCYWNLERTMRNDTDYIETLVYIYEQIIESARITLRCAPMYGTFLKEVQSWMKLALTINSSLPLKPADRRYVLMDLEYELNWLKNISHTFAKKKVVRSFYTYFTLNNYNDKLLSILNVDNNFNA